jgi:hypothetical protein
VNIRGYEFNKVSGVGVSGASVDVWDAVDGTPAGSPLASTTTTSAGRWEFTGLTDTPKDVRVTFSGSIRWYKGLQKVSVTELESTFLTIQSGGQLSLLGNMVVNASAVIQFGATPGGAGTLRFTNAQQIDWRNAANTQDHAIYFDGSDQFKIDVNGATAILLSGNSSSTTMYFGGGSGAGNIRLMNAMGINWRNSTNTNDHSITWDNGDVLRIKPSLSTAFSVGSTFASIGSANQASAGLLRLQNLGSAGAINWRNNANSGDIGFYYDSGDIFTMTGATKDNAASAGGGNSTPATTSGYLPINYNGTRYKIPLYV